MLSFFDPSTANPQMNIAVYHCRSDGTFEAGQEIAPDLRRVADIAIGDLDGEHQLDVAAIPSLGF